MLTCACLLLCSRAWTLSVKLCANCSKFGVEGEGFALSLLSMDTHKVTAGMAGVTFRKPSWQDFPKSPGLCLSPSLSMTRECPPVTIPVCTCSEEKKKISLLKTNGAVFYISEIPLAGLISVFYSCWEASEQWEVYQVSWKQKNQLATQPNSLLLF